MNYMREKIERAIDMMLVTAEFNKYYINDSANLKGEKYYSIEKSFHNPKGIQVYEFCYEEAKNRGEKSKEIVIKKSSDGEYSFAINIKIPSQGREDNITEEQILSDEDLTQEFLQHLSDKLNDFHFNYEDINSGRALSLQPEGSNVSLHIEEYLLRLASMLSEGIPSKAYVKSTYTEGEFPMTIMFSTFSGKANFTFEFANRVMLPNSSQNVSCEEAISKIKPEDIESYPLSLPMSTKAENILRDLLKIDLKAKLDCYTSGLNSNATFGEVARVIQFRANHRDITEEEIKQMNEMLGDHGVVIKNEQPQLKK